MHLPSEQWNWLRSHFICLVGWSQSFWLSPQGIFWLCFKLDATSLTQFSSSFEQSWVPSHTQLAGMQRLFEHLNCPGRHVFVSEFGQLLSISSSPDEQSFAKEKNNDMLKIKTKNIFHSLLTSKPSHKFSVSMHSPSEHKYWFSWHFSCLLRYTQSFSSLPSAQSIIELHLEQGKSFLIFVFRFFSFSAIPLIDAIVDKIIVTQFHSYLWSLRIHLTLSRQVNSCEPQVPFFLRQFSSSSEQSAVPSQTYDFGIHCPLEHLNWPERQIFVSDFRQFTSSSPDEQS